MTLKVGEAFNHSLRDIQPLIGAESLFRNSIQKRLNPDSPNFQLRVYQGGSQFGVMAADDQTKVLEALEHVNVLVRAALTVPDDDPLWNLYFGETPP
jgi:hypothetical protein